MFVFAINPLQPGVAFLYPLKTSENLGFLMFSGGIEKATPGCNGLILFSLSQSYFNMSVSFLSERSNFVSCSYFVVLCLFPFDICGKNSMLFLKFVDPSLEKPGHTPGNEIQFIS